MRALILIALVAVCGYAHATGLRAGIAKVNLEPPLGTPMAGYGKARFAKGTLDPIEARVLALSDGSRTIAFVTLDLCFPFEPPIMDEIRQQTRGTVDEVIFHSSHTHSGPTYAEAPEAAQHAATRVVEAIHQATKSLTPVRIGSAWGQVYIGSNRRYVELDGTEKMFWRNEFKISTTYPVDPTVGVIRIDRQDGTPLAILVSYACHPVVLGPDNLDYSADWPGEMRRRIEQDMGHDAMAFFLQGAPGDINPYYDKTPLVQDAVEIMRQTGQKVGSEAVRVARTIHTQTADSPHIETQTVVLSVKNRWDVARLETIVKARYHSTAGQVRRLLAKEMQLPVTTILLNLGSPDRDLALVGMPGEPFVEFQMQLRIKSPLPNSFLIGYTNGYFAYFPTLAAATRGGYGANSVTTVAEVGTGERMLNTGLISIYDLLGMVSDKPGKPHELASSPQ